MSKLGQFVEFFIYGVFFTSVLMLVLGAVFWAQGQFNSNAGCTANKKLNEAAHVYTDTEIEAFYQACQAEAAAEIRWAFPLCIKGAAIFVVMSIPVFYLFRGRGTSSQGKKYSTSKK